MKQSFIILILVLLLILPCTASVISLERATDGTYLSFDSDQPYSIKTFTVQMNYTSEITINSVKEIYPYTLYSNIQNEKGWTRITGYPLKPVALPAANHIRLARIEMIGEWKGTIFVEYLDDFNKNKIKVDNQALTEKTNPTATPTPLNIDYNPLGRTPFDQPVTVYPTSTGNFMINTDLARESILGTQSIQPTNPVSNPLTGTIGSSASPSSPIVNPNTSQVQVVTMPMDQYVPTSQLQQQSTQKSPIPVMITPIAFFILILLIKREKRD